MRIIGITGPTGAGKSLLSQLFQRSNIPTIDADRVYHDMLLPPSECLDALRAAFGEQIFAADGTLDRARLGEIVFSSEEKLELLNKTVLSRVIARIKQMIFEYEKSGYRAVAVDAPTLIESGFDKECDTVISVLSPKEQRTERIMKRDSIDAERAALRVNAQKDDSFYTESSHFVLHNDGERDSFEKAAAELLSSLDLI